MSVYYDLYASGNPKKKDEQQPLHARVIPSGTLLFFLFLRRSRLFATREEAEKSIEKAPETAFLSFLSRNAVIFFLCTV